MEGLGKKLTRLMQPTVVQLPKIHEVCGAMPIFRCAMVYWVARHISGYWGKGEFSRPYNSADGVPEHVGWFIVAIAVVLFLFIAYKLKKGSKRTSSLRKDRSKG